MNEGTFQDRKLIEKLEEDTLIVRILAGERDLFHDLIRPHEQTVYRMVYGMLRNEIDAEDAVQAAMIQAYLNLAKYRGESRFSTWLVTIALNEGRQRLRKSKTLREDSIDALSAGMDGEAESDYTPALLTDWREVPSEALERKEVREHLHAAIAALPTLYREVLLLRDVEELDVEETAVALCLNTNVVKVRLHRARRLLQKNLAPVLRDYAPRRKGWLGGLR